MSEARMSYQEELQRQESETLKICDRVVDSLRRTVEAIFNQDQELAELVIADDEHIDAYYLRTYNDILSLLARQAPVAIDLRLVLALLQTSVHLERIGDLCVNISKLVPLAGSKSPVDTQILDWIKEMGEQDILQLSMAKRAIAERDVKLAESLVDEDDSVDQLNRRVFRRALEIGSDADVREWASFMMFVARYLERIGDHTVDVGEQASFVVTGLFREFTDASRPDSLAISGIPNN